MTKFKEILKKLFTSSRAFSFYWRWGLASMVMLTAYLTEVLPQLELGEFATVTLIYILNEVTKVMNTKQKNE